MPPSQSKSLSHWPLDMPELGTLAPVAHPIPSKFKRGHIWSVEEDKLLEQMVPDITVSFKEIQTKLPWRTLNAILLRSSRLGLKAEYPEVLF